ncbi:hypothetical protein [Fervidobacterium pennivorans]|nr:hypothetical protein [Fervidobacterium pennivorans]
MVTKLLRSLLKKLADIFFYNPVELILGIKSIDFLTFIVLCKIG